MIHFGDITKLSGEALPIVDVITGGSPCQDLSVAGRRAGLDGERSGLFMEQVRIVKEMRDHDRELHGGRSDVNLRPRYMVWENVPGAFSSNKGKDFQAVLTEIVKIVEPESADVPMPEKGKWDKAGCIYDEMGCWSIAWRVHDAQFWGVPQRRKRIALVADFGGLSAPEVLFERKGVSRHSESSGKERETATGDSESRIGEAGRICLNDQGGGRMNVSEGVAGTLRAQDHGHPPTVVTSESQLIPYTLKIRGGKEGGGKGPLVQEDKSATLSTSNDQTLFAPVAFGICSDRSNSMRSKNPYSGIYVADTSRTLDTSCAFPACAQGGIAIVGEAYPIEGNGQRPSHLGDGWNDSDVMYTLNATEQHGVAYGIDRAAFNMGQNAKFGFSIEEELKPTLVAKGPNAVAHPIYTTSHASHHTQASEGIAYAIVATDSKDPPTIAEYPSYVVRRITPLECERLQGFPDNWTLIGDLGEDGQYYYTDTNGKRKKVSDGARFKALGNSIALPFWQWLARRITAQYERDITMGSLFDGIGGFPYVFERCGATAVWASEIEEFPIAVTKLRFPEDEL